MSFYVTIMNGNGKEIKVKVTLEIFEIFEEERKEAERLRKQKERHISDEDVESDITAYLNSLRTTSLEEKIMQRSEIKSAMDGKRKIKAHLLNNLRSCDNTPIH